MRRTTTFLAVALLALSLTMLPACGEDDDTSPDPGTDTVEPTDTDPGTDTEQTTDTQAEPEVGVDTEAEAEVVLPCEEACTDVEENPCIAACDGVECGDGGVEGCLCGEFDGGCENATDICEGGLCIPCEPSCGDAVCGDDGCGGSCGECGDLQACEDGACIDLTVCDYPPTTWGDFLKVNDLAFNGDGMDGHGLDIDGDAATCAPVDNCENGIDNSLGALKGILATYVDVDVEIANALAEGSIILLGEGLEVMTDGTAFTMNMYLGDLADPDSGCDFQTETCEYVIDPMSFTEDTHCPLIYFDNCTINGTELFCGGDGYIFTVSIPISAGMPPLTLAVHMARILAQVTVDADVITSATGLIAGAVPAQSFDDAIFALATCTVPGDIATCTIEAGGMSLPATVVKNLITTAVTWDIDINEDGVLDESDAASIGLGFGMIQGTLVDPFIAAE